MNAVAMAQREFWSKVAGDYDRVVDRQIGGRTRALARERLAKEERVRRLAEFGCGTGFFTEALAGKADLVVATDLSPQMLAIAQDRVRASNVRFQTQDCQKTSFRDGAFDAAVMSLVLHFTDPENSLAEMRRILKPGGTLVIVNPDRESLRGLDRIRSEMRILYHGVTGYRLKPPKGFATKVSGARIARLFGEHGFVATAIEGICDSSRSSNVPLLYARAVKVE